MAHITFKNVNIDFPIYNSKNRSLKNTVMQAATGGKVSFGAEGAVIRSLENISFEIHEGDRVGLIGHNGSGKSTLLRALSNVYVPTSGYSEIEGEIGSLVDIGLGIDGEATGRENIFIRGALLGLRKKDIEKDKKMQVYCTCPCEFYCKHIYAVILAIRNNKYNRFYKIMYRNPNKNLLERIMDFEYFLCLGTLEQNFEIINNYGELELIPILDKNDKYNWEIIEDSEDEKLAKQVKYFLDNNYF